MLCLNGILPLSIWWYCSSYTYAVCVSRTTGIHNACHAVLKSNKVWLSKYEGKSLDWLVVKLYRVIGSTIVICVNVFLSRACTQCAVINSNDVALGACSVIQCRMWVMLAYRAGPQLSCPLPPHPLYPRPI